MADTTVSDNQIYSPHFQVNSGDTLSVLNGGTADGVDVNSDGREDVYSGGTAINTSVYSGGGQIVQGHAISTFVNGGAQTLINNGSAFTALAEHTILVSGGRQTVYGETSAVDTTIDVFGQQDVNGGIARTTRISGGVQNVLGGKAFDTNIVGVATTVDDDGVPRTITQFGRQAIASGGSADETTVGSGGQQYVFEGGKATNTLVVSGGAQQVGTSGSTAGVVVDSLGLLLIQSGGLASEVRINAGTADLLDGAVITTTDSNDIPPTITFGDGAGTLVIEHPQGGGEKRVAEAMLAESLLGGSYEFEPSLTTFGPGDSIDLTHFVYDPNATATLLPGTTTLQLKSGNDAIIAEFQLVNPGSTTFKVSDDGRTNEDGVALHGTLITADTPASGGGGGGGGGGAPAGGGTPSGGGTGAPPSNNGTSPPSNNTTGLSVAFDPKISVAPGDVVTLSGTYAGAAGVPSILISEDGSALGIATVNPNGTWSLTVDYTALPGPHTNVTATATDGQGRQATGISPYNLTTDYSHVKPDGLPYRTVQNNYDSTGAYTGSIFFNRNGTEYFESKYQNNGDGGSTYTYSGGTYFKKKNFSAFSDSYDVQNIDIYGTDGELISHAEDNNDSTRKVDVYGHNAALDASGAPSRFVFDPGLGNLTISNFKATGPNHDSIDLGNVSSARLASILRTQPNADGDLTLNIGHGNVVTLIGVDHVTKRDFTHSA